MTAAERILDELTRVTGMSPRHSSGQWLARCPAHEDRSPSLAVRAIEGQALVYCHAGCRTDDVVAALGLTVRDLYDQPHGDSLTHYLYTDAAGKPTRTVYRLQGKDFRQSGDKRVAQLYRLPQVVQGVKSGAVIYLVEGEKDVHALESLGAIATTGPMGGNNFHKVDVSPLKGARVVAIADRDGTGVQWAATVRQRLQGYAASLALVEAKQGKDAADHIAAGCGLEDFTPLEREQATEEEDVPPDSAARSQFAATLLRRSQLADLPPVVPLIEGVLSRRSAAILFGPTGAGKTLLALGWACAVGTGLDWLGHPVARCPVLYVVGEGASGLDLRVSAWEYAWQAKVSDEDVVFSVKPASFAERGVWADLTEQAIALGVQFVVLDTFSSLAPDADETKDAPTFTRRLSDLAAAIDGTALVVHHPGWSDADRTRGGYQLEANVDEVLKLSGSGASELVELTRKKVKEGQSGERTWLRRRFHRLGEDAEGKPFGSVVIESASAAERALRAVDEAETVAREVFGVGTVSKAQLRDALAERLDVSRTTAYEHVGRLITSGVLRRTGGTDQRPVYEVSQ